MAKRMDRTGMIADRVEVIRSLRFKGGHEWWECRCECGRKVVFDDWVLSHGKRLACDECRGVDAVRLTGTEIMALCADYIRQCRKRHMRKSRRRA